MLPVGQPLGALPERPAGALQPASAGLVAGPPGEIPDLAADLVERVDRELDDVEGVEAEDRLRAPRRDRTGDPLAEIAGDELDLGAAFDAELGEERLDRLAVTAGGRPDQPARLVVNDDGDVALPGPVGELVDPDPA